MSADTVPVLGLGIKPRGPSNLAICANLAIIAGSATATSKFKTEVSLIFLINSYPPTNEAPASVASFSLVSVTKAAMRLVLPVP